MRTRRAIAAGCVRSSSAITSSHTAPGLARVQAAAGLRHIELRAAELDAPTLNGGERTLVRCAIVSQSCCATAARMRGAQKHLKHDPLTRFVKLV